MKRQGKMARLATRCRTQMSGALVIVLLLVVTLWGYAARAAETTTYVLTDVQGTVLAREDAHGTTIAAYDYRPYGKQQTGPTTAGPGYTGHVDDPDTGLVYMHARYYDPVGRMLSVDPVAGEAGDIFGFNRYAYVNNNPISNIDLDGKQAEDAAEVEAEFIRARQENLLRPLPPYQPPDPIISSIQAAQEAEANQEILNPGSTAKTFNDAVDRILNPAPESTQTSAAETSSRAPGSDGKRGSTGGPGSGKRFPAEPPEVRAEKEGVPCVYCGTPTTNRSGQPNSRERDHIDPRSRGGNNSPENERDSCRSCNRRKGARNPDEWRHDE